MIKNKKDYYEYLEADRIANLKRRKYPLPVIDIVWKQLIILRRSEYHLNCMRDSFIKTIICGYDKFVLNKLALKTGIQISPNCFGKGLTIYHHGLVVCNATVKAGDYVTLQMGINIAADVTIGDNVYIAPGVKIAKGVSIPDNCIIGYNSVVTKSLLEPNSTYVGIPAKKIKSTGSLDEFGNRKIL